jgi:hypothetical protein
MATRKRDLLFTGVFLGIVALVWLVGDLLRLQELAPPSGVDTLAEFAACMPPPVKLTDDGDSIIWVGELAKFPSQPSGPSVPEALERTRAAD